MSIDIDLVKHIAELSRLDLGEGLNEAEARAAWEKMTSDLASIVGHMDIMAEAETDNVEPLYSLPTESAGPREDIPSEVQSAEDILAQAPDRLDNYFVVPKIL